MVSEILADFKARMMADDYAAEAPVGGRVLMNQHQLVAALPDRNLTIDLATIVDVTQEKTLMGGQMSGPVMTIAYRELNEIFTIILGAAPDHLKHFRQLLFKNLLNGTQGVLKSQAGGAGQRTDTSFQSTTLMVEPGKLHFNIPTDRVTYELANVLSFSYRRQEIPSNPSFTHVIKLIYSRNGKEKPVFFALGEPRLLNLLGRFLQIEQSDLLEAVGEETSLT